MMKTTYQTFTENTCNYTNICKSLRAATVTCAHQLCIAFMENHEKTNHSSVRKATQNQMRNSCPVTFRWARHSVTERLSVFRDLKPQYHRCCGKGSNRFGHERYFFLYFCTVDPRKRTRLWFRWSCIAEIAWRSAFPANKYLWQQPIKIILSRFATSFSVLYFVLGHFACLAPWR